MHRIYAPIREIIENLENFTVDINHEFKTSLSEILSSLELAQETQEYKETNRKVIRSTKKLNALLDSLSSTLHFSNSEYRKQKIDLTDFIEHEI
jgi:signal transduction histidine kinase